MIGKVTGHGYKEIVKGKEFEISPGNAERFNHLIDTGNGLNDYLAASNKFFQEAFLDLRKRKEEWWTRMREDLNLKLTKEDVTYSREDRKIIVNKKRKKKK